MAENVLKDKFPLNIFNRDAFWKNLASAGVGAFVMFCVLYPFQLQYSNKSIIDPARPYGELTTHEGTAHVYPYHTDYTDTFGIVSLNHEPSKFYACVNENGTLDNKYPVKEKRLYSELQSFALSEGYKPDTNHYCE